MGVESNPDTVWRLSEHRATDELMPAIWKF